MTKQQLMTWFLLACANQTRWVSASPKTSLPASCWRLCKLLTCKSRFGLTMLHTQAGSDRNLARRVISGFNLFWQRPKWSQLPRKENQHKWSTSFLPRKSHCLKLRHARFLWTLKPVVLQSLFGPPYFFIQPLCWRRKSPLAGYWGSCRGKSLWTVRPEVQESAIHFASWLVAAWP